MGQIGDPTIIEILLDALSDTDGVTFETRVHSRKTKKEFRVCDASAEALGSFGEMAIPALMETFENALPNIQECIMASFRIIGPYAAQALIDKLDEFSSQAPEGKYIFQDGDGAKIIALGKWEDKCRPYVYALRFFPDNNEAIRSRSRFTLLCKELHGP